MSFQYSRKSSFQYSPKGYGIAEGQTLQVAVRKCMAENYFEVQKTILERDQSFSSTQFYQKPIWAMLICG